ncbi:MAG TPA: hypothetical protein VFQ43_15090 [Nitrososphaera sp.]|nr:hypothetical protein [Nitrososphaera sp.]
MPNLYAYASFHVEHIDKEYAAGAEPEAEFQEPEGQYEAADPEQEQEADFTDSFSQQGKHRCMINLVPFTTESYNATLLMH